MWDPVGSRTRAVRVVRVVRNQLDDRGFVPATGSSTLHWVRRALKRPGLDVEICRVSRTSGGFWPQIADQLAVLDCILSGFLFSTVFYSLNMSQLVSAVADSGRQGTRIRHQCLSFDVLWCPLFQFAGLPEFLRDKSTTFNPYKTSAPWRLMCHICCSHFGLALPVFIMSSTVWSSGISHVQKIWVTIPQTNRDPAVGLEVKLPRKSVPFHAVTRGMSKSGRGPCVPQLHCASLCFTVELGYHWSHQTYPKLLQVFNDLHLITFKYLQHVHPKHLPIFRIRGIWWHGVAAWCRPWDLWSLESGRKPSTVPTQIRWCQMFSVGVSPFSQIFQVLNGQFCIIRSTTLKDITVIPFSCGKKTDAVFVVVLVAPARISIWPFGHLACICPCVLPCFASVQGSNVAQVLRMVSPCCRGVHRVHRVHRGIKLPAGCSAW